MSGLGPFRAIGSFFQTSMPRIDPREMADLLAYEPIDRSPDDIVG